MSTELSTKIEDRAVSYVPFGSKEEITLSYGQVLHFISNPTASGARPSKADIVKFMQLCAARQLNPWVGDAFMIGYDDQRLGPQFTLITAIQALLKRAEANSNYDGMESGVMVRDKDGKVSDRPGAFVFDNEELLGAWAYCYRRDRKQPDFARIKLSVYSTGRSRWKKDPGGMIEKCARAAVLRAAFPTQLGGLYVDEERDAIAGTVIGTLADKKTAGIQGASSFSEMTEEPEEEPEESPAGEFVTKDGVKVILPNWDELFGRCDDQHTIDCLKAELVAKWSDHEQDIILAGERREGALKTRQNDETLFEGEG